MTAALAPAPSNPWEMKVGSGDGNGDYVLCPSGSWTGLVVGLFDVGHRPTTNQKGESYDRRELVLVFELVKKRPDGKPFVLAERYTWSMKDNSNFYALACNLTGVKYKDGETFDPRRLLGLPCSVSVTHQQGKKDATKTYHNIGGVQQWASEDDEGNAKPRPKPTREPVCWSILEGRVLPDISWVPRIYGDTITTMVECATEFKAGIVPSAILPDPNGDSAASPLPDPDNAPGGANDIPF